jgi:HSP20 family protein
LSDADKKKMNYYYSGKEKSAVDVKKGEEIVPYTTWDVQRHFNRLMDKFQRDFEDFWGESSRVGRDMTRKARRSIAPFTGASMPSVDIEDQGKNYRLTVDLPGFKKEDVQVDLEEDSVTINARRSTAENEQNKNYIRHERSEQTFYRKIHLPEPVRSDQSNAKLNNGILDITLPKKEPKETKKLTVM